MDLAMRFLSAYSCPKFGSNVSNFQGNKSNLTRKGSGILQAKDGKSSKYLCWAFNSNGCQFDACKYAHIYAVDVIPLVIHRMPAGIQHLNKILPVHSNLHLTRHRGLRVRFKRYVTAIFIVNIGSLNV